MQAVTIDQFVHSLTDIPGPETPELGPVFLISDNGGNEGVPIKVVSRSEAAEKETVILLCFHGAIDQSVRPIPFFSQGFHPASIYKSFATVISVADPSLRMNEQLITTWYAGDHSTDTMGILKNFTDRLASAFPKARFIFFAGSTGCRPALLLSHRIPESLCVAVNPWASLENFKPDSDLYRTFCWPEELDTDKLVTRIELSGVANLYSAGHENHVLVLQNAFDPRMTMRVLPLLAKAFSNSRRFMLLSEHFPEMLKHDYPWEAIKLWFRAFMRAEPVSFPDIAKAFVVYAEESRSLSKTEKRRQFDPRDLVIARQLRELAQIEVLP